MQQPGAPRAGTGLGAPPPPSSTATAPHGGPPTPLASIFGGPSTFPSSQDLLKATSTPTNPLQASSFGSSGSMSPSTQMLRSIGSGFPAPQRQNSSSSWGNTAAAALRTTPGGATTPGIDFRSHGPPSVADFASTPPARQLPPFDDLATITFSDDIQEEANSYFEQIYSPNGTMSVADLLQKLKTFRNSTNQRDRDILSCVVKNLFEEYRFFHEYPERELKTTAEVYGGIIREGIISNLQFATAVRKVIESLQAEYGSMLWTFGIVSLTACKIKLSAYPKVCAMIAQHENFARFPAGLKEYVTAGIQGRLPAESAVGRETPPPWQQPRDRNLSGDSTTSGARLPPGAVTRPGGGNPVLSMTNVDTLVKATEKEGVIVKQPAEVVTEKVSFLFNNLSQSNMNSKKEEILGLIESGGDEFLRWLAQYMVMKRVSVEVNFQPLYNSFLQSIASPQLDEYVKMETFRNIRILLRSDKRQAASSNYSDRQLLKNLGLWLGTITISRARPILLSDLDLKSLLLEAYYKGQQELLFVVPFIAKILTSCAKTTIFAPTCAWIRSIMKILAELHNEPDLKINLKFEIEVLCKELSIDLQSLPIDGILKDVDKLVKLPQQLSDLRVLARPDAAVGPSPVPSQMRAGGGLNEDSGSSSAAKPSTPAPGGETSETAGVEPPAPAPANYSYNDISTVTLDGIVPHLKINPSLHLFQAHPHLKHMVGAAIKHAIKELLGPVTERALKVAMTVTEHVCKKDFALDGDEQHLRRASQHMMRAMTAGMAAITCRDPLTTALFGYLSQAFTNSLQRSGPVNTEQTRLIDDAARVLTSDNVELTTNFIVKSACEKATPELDKRLDAEFKARQAAKREGKEWSGDNAVLELQASMPEALRVRLGAVSEQQMAIYDEFATKICGFKPAPVDEGDVVVGNAGPKNDNEIESFAAHLLHVVKEVDSALSNHQAHSAARGYNAVATIREALQQLATSPREIAALNALLQKCVEQLLLSYRNEQQLATIATQGTVAAQRIQAGIESDWARRLRELFVGLCRVILQHGLMNVTDLARRVTAVVVGIRADHRFNTDAIELLLRSHLIQIPVYDEHLSHAMDNGMNVEATMHAQRLIKALTAEASRAPAVRESFSRCVELLAKMQAYQSTNRPTPTSESNGSAELLGVPTVNEDSGDLELQSKVEMILREWIALCYTTLAQREPQQALAQIVHLMHEQGVLHTDEMITRFFRLCTEMCIDVSYKLLKTENQAVHSPSVRQRCYYTLDAFVKLTCLMVKHSDGAQYQTKINLLKKVLNTVTTVLCVEHEQVRRNDFHAMPYHRILIIMFNELTAPDPNLEPIAWNILEAFGQALFLLQPRRVPGFAYAWLDIVGHRNVIARMLGESCDLPKTQAMYTQLIICHLKFLAPFLRNIHLPKSIAVMYKGTLRVLLVILHDFPELLCEYHYVICDTIPPNCIQLRNLVLSAYPRNMRLPDPFALTFKAVDSIPEMSQEPKLSVNLQQIIPADLRSQLDEYLNTRSSVSFLSTLPGLLQVSSTPGQKYNTTVMNAVVLYIGMRAIENLREKRLKISITTIAHTSFMDIFQNLAVQLCTEGRYLLFNAIANQLRFPNSHTHYFSCAFLFLFLQADSPSVQEQITRVLFERLVALRPHPWGLLITFIELIKNPQYGFWNHEFTRCAPEIERLFQNVAATCVADGGARRADADAASAS